MSTTQVRVRFPSANRSGITRTIILHRAAKSTFEFQV
jgi:hypothetical protein